MKGKHCLQYSAHFYGVPYYYQDVYNQQLEEKLTELKESQDDNWQKLKDGFEENQHKVKDSIKKAFDYFKK